MMERDLKQVNRKSVPLQFEAATQLLQGEGCVLGQHFCLNSADTLALRDRLVDHVSTSAV